MDKSPELHSLFEAARKGHLNAVMTHCYAQPRLFFSRDPTCGQCSLLVVASAAGHEDLVQWLLSSMDTMMAHAQAAQSHLRTAETLYSSSPSIAVTGSTAGVRPGCGIHPCTGEPMEEAGAVPHAGPAVLSSRSPGRQPEGSAGLMTDDSKPTGPIGGSDCRDGVARKAGGVAVQGRAAAERASPSNRPRRQVNTPRSAAGGVGAQLSATSDSEADGDGEGGVEMAGPMGEGRGEHAYPSPKLLVGTGGGLSGVEGLVQPHQLTTRAAADPATGQRSDKRLRRELFPLPGRGATSALAGPTPHPSSLNMRSSDRVLPPPLSRSRRAVSFSTGSDAAALHPRSLPHVSPQRWAHFSVSPLVAPIPLAAASSRNYSEDSVAPNGASPAPVAVPAVFDTTTAPAPPILAAPSIPPVHTDDEVPTCAYPSADAHTGLAAPAPPSLHSLSPHSIDKRSNLTSTTRRREGYNQQQWQQQQQYRALVRQQAILQQVQLQQQLQLHDALLFTKSCAHLDALSMSALHGHIQVVRILLACKERLGTYKEQSRCRWDEREAVRQALRAGRWNVAILLLSSNHELLRHALLQQAL